MKRAFRYGWIPLLVIAADQVTKALAETLTRPVTLIPGVVGLELTHNTGVAFSLLSGAPWLAALLPIPVLACGFLFLRRCRLGPLSLTGGMLIAGGAVSNMIDRLFRGQVTDMVKVLAFDFAVFNFADAALTIGCILLILSLFLKPNEWERKADGRD